VVIVTSVVSKLGDGSENHHVKVTYPGREVSAGGQEPWQLKKGEEPSESGAIVPRVTEKSVDCHLVGRQKKVDPQRRCIVCETHSAACNRLLPARGGSV
jgi:hypothetical protein